MRDMQALARSFALISRGTAAATLESPTLEFKTEKPSPKETFSDLAEAAVCLANAGGGIVVLGIADSPGGPSAFIGTHIQPDLLRHKIYDLTRPHLDTVVDIVEHADVPLLVVRVNEGLDVFSTSRGVSSRRIGQDCVPLSATEINRLSEDRRGIDWASVSSGRPVAEADGRAIRRLRVLVAQSGRMGELVLPRATDEDMLRALGLVASSGHLTRAGEILLCDDARSAPGELLVYQFRRTRGGEMQAAHRWGAPLLIAIEDALAAIAARQGLTPVTLRTGVQLQLEDFPSSAVREAVVNAVVHGDLRFRRPVQIEHSPEALAVTSPGPLVAGVTSQNILTRGSRARFPSLAKVVRLAGLAEELGQGVDRMFRAMIAQGKPPPLIEDRGDEVAVTFAGDPPNKRVAAFVHDLPDDEKDDTDALLVIHDLCRRPSVTARDIALVIQRSEDDSQRILHRLSTGQAELLEPTKGTAARRFPNYRLRHDALAALGPAVKYRRRDTRELESKVVAHVTEYDYINNSTLQRLFDVDVYQARDMLRELVGREILVRTSTQTRGKAVRYGPGPRFHPGRRP